MGPCYSNDLLCPLQNSFYSESVLLWDLHAPPLNAQSNTVTVSGVSGGSFFASTASIVYSDVIKGTGLFVGGPFGA